MPFVLLCLYPYSSLNKYYKTAIYSIPLHIVLPQCYIGTTDKWTLTRAKVESNIYCLRSAQYTMVFRQYLYDAN